MINLIITTLSISIMSMSGMVISPALNDIALYYNDIPSIYIQMLVTVPSICMIPSSLLSTKIKDIFSYKQIFISCLMILLCCGLAPIFLKNFAIIFICRVLIGLSIGLLTPINTSLITTYIPQDKKSKILGLSTALESFGGAFMVVFSAYLASKSWDLCFIVYLLSLIPLTVVLFVFDDIYYKNKTETKNKSKTSMNKIILGYACILCIYMVFLNVFSTCISSLIIEKNIGNTMLSGIVIAIYLISGFVCGILYENTEKLFKNKTFAFGILFCAIGIFLLYMAKSEGTLILGSIISDYGMNQAITASLNLASHYSDLNNQTFNISIILSGSRIGQFLTTLIYIPVLNQFKFNYNQYYLMTTFALLLMCLVTMLYEKVINKK